MNTHLNKYYLVEDDSEIRLKITIFHGQKGFTIARLGSDVILDNVENDLEITLPKLGGELKGKKLFCSTVVEDCNKYTNKTGIAYEMTGGVIPYERKLEESVESEGDILFYTAIFIFV